MTHPKGGMTVDQFAKSVHDLLLDPQPGMIAKAGGDGQARTVKMQFVDATDEPRVIFTVEHNITLKAWKRWCKSRGTGLRL